MIDLFDHPVNRRAISGAFPDCELFPSSENGIEEIDFEEKCIPGMSILKKDSEIVYYLIMAFSERIKDIDSLKRPKLYVQDINVIINTRYSIDSFNGIGEAYNTARSLCPVVTSLDKVLWYAALAYYSFVDSQIQFGDHSISDDIRNMIYVWIRLLLLAQSKELETGRTINLKSLKPSISIIDILSSSWEKKNKYTVELTDQERSCLLFLHNKRMQLQIQLRAEREMSASISNRTSEAWGTFIKIINDISRQERLVIRRLISVSSPKDKLDAIKAYNRSIEGIERLQYVLNNKAINLFLVYKSATERLNYASTYCRVHTETGKPFRLNVAIAILAMNPYTYNYLFISYHYFRLAPNNNNAIRFVDIALQCLRKNLALEEIELTSMDEKIRWFHDSVTAFVNDNMPVLKTISYKQLQPDSVVVGDFAIGIFSTELYRYDFANRMKCLQKNGAFEKTLYDIFNGKSIQYSSDEVALQVKMEEDRITQIDKQALARQVVLSLNIIYLFCDALRILITNRFCRNTVQDIPAVKKYRNDLLRIDDMLVHIVYSHLDNHEIGMLEYRENAGISPYSLSEQEIQEETYRNTLFSKILKGSIESLLEDLEELNIQQVMERKEHIREEILRFPSCDEKDRYADWIDSISASICKRLIALCQQDKDSFIETKNSIISGIGAESKKLSSTVINTLTTAEMLYRRYANSEYSEKGFDYSSISALYYQAFENAYNELIWSGYATMLNALIINGQPFTSILAKNRYIEIDVQEAKGYLSPNAKDRGYYVTYKSKTKSIVNEQCMYKSFAILMEKVVCLSELDKYCDYFAKLCGFMDKEEMYADTDFMEKIKSFSEAIEDATEDRNNASHGGTHISRSQCETDKMVVLHDLETVRSNSIGLIQKMLYLLRNGVNKSPEHT